jgi:DNA adenine methylase
LTVPGAAVSRQGANPHFHSCRDTAGTFFYLDPPHVGTDQGHYDGYTQEDFNALLETLVNIKGRFLLSSFRNKRLADFTGRNGWETVEVKMAYPMSNKYKISRTKIEVLTANYPILPVKIPQKRLIL